MIQNFEALERYLSLAPTKILLKYMKLILWGDKKKNKGIISFAGSIKTA